MQTPLFLIRQINFHLVVKCCKIRSTGQPFWLWISALRLFSRRKEDYSEGNVRTPNWKRDSSVWKAPKSISGMGGLTKEIAEPMIFPVQLYSGLASNENPTVWTTPHALLVQNDGFSGIFALYATVLSPFGITKEALLTRTRSLVWKESEWDLNTPLPAQWKAWRRRNILKGPKARSWLMSFFKEKLDVNFRPVNGALIQVFLNKALMKKFPFELNQKFYFLLYESWRLGFSADGFCATFSSVFSFLKVLRSSNCSNFEVHNSVSVSSSVCRMNG